MFACILNTFIRRCHPLEFSRTLVCTSSCNTKSSTYRPQSIYKFDGLCLRLCRAASPSICPTVGAFCVLFDFWFIRRWSCLPHSHTECLYDLLDAYVCEKVIANISISDQISKLRPTNWNTRSHAQNMFYNFNKEHRKRQRRLCVVM